MQVWLNLLLVLQVLSALVMIGLVLVQHGKGADMGASFGSGASGSLFGATGSANFLSRSTAVCASVFFVCTLALAYSSNSVSLQSGGPTGSVLDRAAVPASAPPAQAMIPSAGASREVVVPLPSAATAGSAPAGTIPTR